MSESKIEFKSFNLLRSINIALENKGYTHPTPIQEQAIPHLLKGKDLLGIAQTGTGKTAAFSLPIINHIGLNKIRVSSLHARVLILTPTRELASQIEDNIKAYSKGLNLRTSVIFGGVGKASQKKALRGGLDILVATPGRLLDLMGEGLVKYSELEIFVLDEADRMLDMGFYNDIKKVIKKLPTKKQTLLFSATMPKDISKLATSLLKNPVRVEVTPESTTVEKITQSVSFVAKSNKNDLLKHVIDTQNVTSALVFSRTKHGADRIVRFLEKNNIISAAIHGNKSQNARERALSNFRSAKIQILVATDIAARGIDIPIVSHVINYNLPEDPKSYVHRIGRTARAGREGVAISFCEEDEMKYLKGIEKDIKQKLKIDKDHPFHGVPGKPPIPQGPRKPRNHKTVAKTGVKKKSPFRRKRKPASEKPA